jgi:ATP-binding cassette, subfamily B, bacterial PglK
MSEEELPASFDAIVGERGIRLSGGQRQRIGPAGALYHRPSLLILDEVTSVLNVATEAKLLEALGSLAGKLTMVVAAHRLSTIAGCDKVVDRSNKSAVVAETAT